MQGYFQICISVPLSYICRQTAINCNPHAYALKSAQTPPCLHPLKTSENLKVSGSREKCIESEWVKIFLQNQVLYVPRNVDASPTNLILLDFPGKFLDLHNGIFHKINSRIRNRSGVLQVREEGGGGEGVVESENNTKGREMVNP